MLASVYSYRVMVKSISSCCVRGRWVLSNPVTKFNNQSLNFNSFTLKYLCAWQQLHDGIVYMATAGCLSYVAFFAGNNSKSPFPA